MVQKIAQMALDAAAMAVIVAVVVLVMFSMAGEFGPPERHPSSKTGEIVVVRPWEQPQLIWFKR